MITSRLSSLVILALLVTGCAAVPTVTVPPLPLPERMTVPEVSAEEIECLSVDAAVALIVRDATRKANLELLEAIIAAHNRAAKEN